MRAFFVSTIIFASITTPVLAETVSQRLNGYEQTQTTSRSAGPFASSTVIAQPTTPQAIAPQTPTITAEPQVQQTPPAGMDPATGQTAAPFADTSYPAAPVPVNTQPVQPPQRILPQRQQQQAIAPYSVPEFDAYLPQGDIPAFVEAAPVAQPAYQPIQRHTIQPVREAVRTPMRETAVQPQIQPQPVTVPTPPSAPVVNKTTKIITNTDTGVRQPARFLRYNSAGVSN